jgi:hypothetical protein
LKDIAKSHRNRIARRQGVAGELARSALNPSLERGVLALR